MKKKVCIFICSIWLMTGLCSCADSSLVNDESEDIIMTGEINYSSKLADEFYPNGIPKCTVNEKIKSEFEESLGVHLPDDYYDYINAFGNGSFDDYLRVFNVFISDGINKYFCEAGVNEETMTSIKEIWGMDDLVYEVEDGRIKYKEKEDYHLLKINIDDFDENVRKKMTRCGIGLPYDFSKCGNSGLIYWGRTDDVNFFWNYDKNNEKFYIVAYEENNAFYEFDMSLTEFMYCLLHGEMERIVSYDSNWTYVEYE